MDPLFVFNPDVTQTLLSSHTATNEYQCEVAGRDARGANRVRARAVAPTSDRARRAQAMQRARIAHRRRLQRKLAAI